MYHIEDYIAALDSGELEEASAPSQLWRSWDEGPWRWNDRQRILALTWQLNNYPSDRLEQSQWLAMFKDVGFFTDNDFSSKPRDPWPLYRGHSEEFSLGIAWADKPECAQWWVRFYWERDVDARVFEAIVPPDAVLAILANRREREVIVDPSCLVGSAAPKEREDLVPPRTGA